MLDEPTTPASEDAAPAPRRRRRAASRPAGPPVEVPTSTASGAAGADSPEPTATTLEPTLAESPATPASTETPAAKKPARKRAVRKAAAPDPLPTTESDVSAQAVPPATTAEAVPVEAADAPAKPARKRASRKKAAAAPPAETLPAETLPAETLPAETLPADDAAAPRRTRRPRKAVANPFAAPHVPEADDEHVPEADDDASAGAGETADTAVADVAMPVDEAETDESSVGVQEAETRPPEDANEENLDSENAENDDDKDPHDENPLDEGEGDQNDGDDQSDGADSDDPDDDRPRRRRRRRGGRRRRRGASGDDSDESDDSHGDDHEQAAGDTKDEDKAPEANEANEADANEADDGSDDDSQADGRRRRRRRRRRGESGSSDDDDNVEVVERVREPRRGKASDEVTGIDGSTRMEAKRQRRREGRAAGRRRTPILSEAEFLARREAVERTMVIRQNEELSQIAVLEDDVLVEHYVDRASATSLIGNVYLGRVQNVLPSMEAAFIDIGRGRNAVLYAGEVDWDAFGSDGQAKKVEKVLKSGQSILVQVTKDPVGAKGARLTNHVSLPGRYIVYAPGGHLSGISRKLSDTERKRLKDILGELVEDDASVIVRTAAEGASEDELVRDVNRLKAQWEAIEKKVKSGQAPQQLYAEPDSTVRIVRDLFTEDFAKLVIDGNGTVEDAYDTVTAYVSHVAPHLSERIERWDGDRGEVFAAHRIDEQIAKALERKVFLPSGGSLIIDRTEAMTVIDVNTGKFTGSGGNLEATVTSNNLEAAEEVVRQLRLRDIGGIIVIDFIDMVLPANRELLLRRLVECLGRDRTRHQVAEVTSLGLVQMTRKKIGTGLHEAFTEDCECCKGRGYAIHDMPVDTQAQADGGDRGGRGRGRGRGGKGRDRGDGGKGDNRPDSATKDDDSGKLEDSAKKGDSAKNGDDQPAEPVKRKFPHPKPKDEAEPTQEQPEHQEPQQVAAEPEQAPQNDQVPEGVAEVLPDLSAQQAAEAPAQDEQVAPARRTRGGGRRRKADDTGSEAVRPQIAASIEPAPPVDEPAPERADD